MPDLVSQFLVIGAKVHAALNGKYSPDIEDVKAVATPILRHRIVRNYKAEADGMTVEKIIFTPVDELLKETSIQTCSRRIRLVLIRQRLHQNQ